MSNVGFRIVTGEAEGFTETVKLFYRILYRDIQNIASPPKFIFVGEVEGTEELPAAVVLYYISAPFDGSLSRLEVYRGIYEDDPVAADGFEPVAGVRYHVLVSDIAYNGAVYDAGDEFVGVEDGGTVDSGVLSQLLALPEDVFLIGEVEGTDEGVFVDNNQDAGAAMPCTKAVIINYESSVRKSEGYAPWWLRAEKIQDFRSGDGDQITGMVSQYGNIVLFKERSMHRMAVQDSRPESMFSRVDEVSPDVGCIAPETAIATSNTVFFLSWRGLMMYDNNVIKAADGAFAEELRFRLSTINEDILRESSCVYNSHWNELYLNIPSRGRERYYEKEWIIQGHIYVLDFTKKYATKYAYMSDPEYGRLMRSHARLYHENSMGELRSAEVRRPATYLGGQPVAGPGTFPDPGIKIIVLNGTIRYNNIDYREGDVFTTIEDIDTATSDDGAEFGYFSQRTAGIFIDAPTHVSYDEYYDDDSLKQSRAIYNNWKSKFFTGGSETTIKRVREVIINMWSEGSRKLSVTSIPRSENDDRIDNGTQYITSHTFGNSSTVASNVLTIIPSQTAFESPGTPIHFDDRYGRPIRVGVELESDGRTQVNEVALYWRPITTYLS